MTPYIALQLYTVRDDLDCDFVDTLRRIAKIGYQHVEFHNLYGKPSEDVRAICDELEISIASRMFPIDVIADDLPLVVEQSTILGNSFVVCPWLPEKYRNVEGYLKVAAILNNAGNKLAEKGLTLCYHNHGFEFDKLSNDTVGFDVIYQQTDQNRLKAELDIYWLLYAGLSPLEVLIRFSGRVPLLHLKDMASDEARSFTEIGAGVVDIISLVKTASSCGVEYLVVEQDANWSGSPIESVETSYQNLSNLLSP